MLSAAVLAFAFQTNTAEAAVVYTVTGTVVEDPAQLGELSEATFSFVFTSPTFITSVSEHVSLDSCSVSSPAFTCTTASFRPSEDKGSFGFWDQIDFEWENVDLSGSGGAQLLFTLGALTTPGTYNVGPISISQDAILTVSTTDVAETPLPGALPLFAGGLGVFGLVGWRRKRKAATPAA